MEESETENSVYNDEKLNWGILSRYRSQLSGIAIIMIMVFHYSENVIQAGKNNPAYHFADGWYQLFGSIGVELFLIVSGVGLWFSFEKSPKVLPFYRRRLKRIVLPYFIVAVPFYILRDIVIQYKMSGKTENFVKVLKDIFFVDFFENGDRILWYIIFIMMMYLLFPIFFLLVKEEKKLAGKKYDWYILPIIVSGFLICLSHVIALSYPDFWKGTEIAWTRVSVFFLGVFIGEKVYKNRKLSAGDTVLFGMAVSIKMLSFGKAFVFWRQQNRIVTGYLSLVLIVTIAIICSGAEIYIKNEKIISKCSSALTWCGERSLELYMIHVTIRGLFNDIGFYTFELWHYLICLAASFLLSAGLHEMVNRIWHIGRNVR